jgi:ATP-dependent DNA helicase 2 subunit 1
MTNLSQRAGEYVLSWADELEKQYAAPAAHGPKSTLAKRSAKDRGADGDECSGHPSKRIKSESGPEGVEVEVRLHYEKGSLSKVSCLHADCLKVANG